MKRAFKIICIAFIASGTMGLAGTSWIMLSTPAIHRLALAPDLVDASSASGQQELANAAAKTDYELLAPEFVGQSRRAFCGVATSVTVLNALLHPQPRLNQDSLFTPKASAVKGELAVSFSGLTLEQLAGLMEAHGAQVKTTHAAQSSIEQFRELARTTLAEPLVFLVVNYDRKALGQEGTGHISPVAAYSAEKDALLILDVAAYKYPSTWVPLPKLWRAMNTIDPDSGQTRGYLLVSARAPSP